MEVIVIMIVGLILGVLNSWYSDKNKIENKKTKEYRKYTPDKNYDNLDIPIADKFDIKENYDSYISSDKWKALKLDRLLIDDFRCQQCKKPVTAETSHCHHTTYQDFGREKLWQIVTVCPKCHNLIHEFHGKNAGRYPLLDGVNHL